MAPLKQFKTSLIRPTINTRSKATMQMVVRENNGKRKAECSPSKDISHKRSAFYDVTNAGIKIKLDESKKIPLKVSKITKKNSFKRTNKLVKKTTTTTSFKTVVKSKPNNENCAPPPAPIINGITTRAAIKNTNASQTALKPKDTTNVKELNVSQKVKTRLSDEFEKTADSLYTSALEDIFESAETSKTKCKSSAATAITTALNTTETATTTTTTSSSLSINRSSSVSFMVQELENKLNLESNELPESVDNFDEENWDDVYQVSHYASDIFNYLRHRELIFDIPDYMDRQICLTRWMRSLLVDWMVEIQESFELNHETLYLAVKLVDIYLSKMTVGKETLQLVGASAMFIASKYDERIPPFIEDFLYVCDGAYNRRELIRMEINLLKICDFDLGIPISYRFLRRYARCAKVTMPVLTLARFILEYSLMDYETVMIRDSKLAAASLYLALRMKNVSEWTPTLEFYTGYKLNQILSVVYLLNNGLHLKPKEQLMTVRNKYSHKIFFEVAKTPTIQNEDLKV